AAIGKQRIWHFSLDRGDPRENDREDRGVDQRHEHRPAESHDRLFIAKQKIAPRHLVQELTVVDLLPQHFSEISGQLVHMSKLTMTAYPLSLLHAPVGTAVR